MVRKKNLALCAIILSGLLLLPAAARAEDGVQVTIGAAVNVGSSPYKDYDVQVTPLPIISLESEYVYIRDLAAGVKLFNHENLEISAFIGYDPNSFDPGDSDDRRLRRLDNRWSSAVAGVNARLISEYGELHVRVAADILGHSDGVTAAAGYEYSLELGPVTVGADVGTYWASADYNDYYYGVSGKESRKSGLSSYNAGAGFSPYAALALSATFAERWTAFCRGEVVFLSDEIRNSPMVDASTTQNLTVGLTYSF